MEISAEEKMKQFMSVLATRDNYVTRNIEGAKSILPMAHEAISHLLAEERREPSCCPVCLGTGQVSAGFYTNGVAGSSTANIQCRSCEGRGYIALTHSQK